MAKGLQASDLRTSTEEELDNKLNEAKIELFNLRFQAATGQLESHGRLRAVRKEISDKMDKTVVVQVEDRVKHPKYGKVIRRTKKYKAHDGENACGVGDRVLLMETLPLSATKRWPVARILEKAK